MAEELKKTSQKEISQKKDLKKAIKEGMKDMNQNLINDSLDPSSDQQVFDFMLNLFEQRYKEHQNGTLKKCKTQKERNIRRHAWTLWPEFDYDYEKKQYGNSIEPLLDWTREGREAIKELFEKPFRTLFDEKVGGARRVLAKKQCLDESCNAFRNPKQYPKLAKALFFMALLKERELLSQKKVAEMEGSQQSVLKFCFKEVCRKLLFPYGESPNYYTEKFNKQCNNCNIIDNFINEKFRQIDSNGIATEQYGEQFLDSINDKKGFDYLAKMALLVSFDTYKREQGIEVDKASTTNFKLERHKRPREENNDKILRRNVENQDQTLNYLHDFLEKIIQPQTEDSQKKYLNRLVDLNQGNITFLKMLKSTLEDLSFKNCDSGKDTSYSLDNKIKDGLTFLDFFKNHLHQIYTFMKSEEKRLTKQDLNFVNYIIEPLYNKGKGTQQVKEGKKNGIVKLKDEVIKEIDKIIQQGEAKTRTDSQAKIEKKNVGNLNIEDSDTDDEEYSQKQTNYDTSLALQAIELLKLWMNKREQIDLSDVDEQIVLYLADVAKKLKTYFIYPNQDGGVSKTDKCGDKGDDVILSGVFQMVTDNQGGVDTDLSSAAEGLSKGKNIPDIIKEIFKIDEQFKNAKSPFIGLNESYINLRKAEGITTEADDLTKPDLFQPPVTNDPKGLDLFQHPTNPSQPYSNARNKGVHSINSVYSGPFLDSFPVVLDGLEERVIESKNVEKIITDAKNCSCHQPAPENWKKIEDLLKQIDDDGIGFRIERSGAENQLCNNLKPIYGTEVKKAKIYLSDKLFEKLEEKNKIQLVIHFALTESIYLDIHVNVATKQIEFDNCALKEKIGEEYDIFKMDRRKQRLLKQVYESLFSNQGIEIYIDKVKQINQNFNGRRFKKILNDKYRLDISPKKQNSSGPGITQ